MGSQDGGKGGVEDRKKVSERVWDFGNCRRGKTINMALKDDDFK